MPNETTPATQTRLEYLLNMLNETSTCRGLIVMIILVGGYAVDPAKIDVYTTAAVAAGGLLKVILPDYWSKTAAAAALAKKA